MSAGQEEGSKGGGGGGEGQNEGLTEVDCPVCYVLRHPVACVVCVSSDSWGASVCFLYGSTHSTATVKHMPTCLVCSSAI